MSGKAKRKGKQSSHSSGTPPAKQRVVILTNGEELPGQLHNRFAKLEAARQQSSRKQAAREQAQQLQRGKREALLHKKRGNVAAEQKAGGDKAEKERRRSSKGKKGLAIPVGKGVSIRRPTAAAGRLKRKQKAKKAGNDAKEQKERTSSGKMGELQR